MQAHGGQEYLTSGEERDSHPLDERSHLHEIHGRVVSRRLDGGRHLEEDERGVLVVHIRMGHGPAAGA